MIIAIDTETTLIDEKVVPKVICVSFANAAGQSKLIAHCNPKIYNIFEDLFKGEDTLVFHNAAFDLTAIMNTWPGLEPFIWAKLERGEITDTLIREKLLNLSSLGTIETLELPTGATERITYHLVDLEKKYLGRDREEDKKGEDIWRLRYSELEGMLVEEYPEEAVEYAIDDAEGTMAVYLAQESRKVEERFATTETEFFQTAVDFALKIFTWNGARIDRKRRDEIVAKLEEELAPENMKPLVDAGILRPGTPPMPYKNGAKNADGTPKMKAAKKPSINKKALTALVEEVCREQDIEVKLTEKGNVSTDAATIQELAPLNEILALYEKRQKLQRLYGTELPRLDADFVHPNYSALKETGRTSSFGNARGSMEPYPSTNIQQVDPRAREVFIPREGHVICSTDYSALELCSVAYTTKKLFGRSVHHELINKGYDLHAYLGAQLALHMDPEFAKYCEIKKLDTPEEQYQGFLELKKGDDVERKFFKHWRKFAKPVGLGLPGGLGTETAVTLAKAVYGVETDINTMERLKKVWFATYPEMRQYFQFVNEQAEDPTRPETYMYTTPGGMLRRGASYCACCNGMVMQSPAAEGAKLAVFNIAKASRVGSLKGAIPWAFIHDEILLDLPEDRAHELAQEVSRIMVVSMEEVLEGVKIKAEPCLMRRWNKAAEAVFDEDGKLIPWEPEEENVS